MKKFSRALTKKPARDNCLRASLEFYTGNEQLVYSLFTTAGKS